MSWQGHVRNTLFHFCQLWAVDNVLHNFDCLYIPFAQNKRVYLTDNRYVSVFPLLSLAVSIYLLDSCYKQSNYVQRVKGFLYLNIDEAEHPTSVLHVGICALLSSIPYVSLSKFQVKLGVCNALIFFCYSCKRSSHLRVGSKWSSPRLESHSTWCTSGDHWSDEEMLGRQSKRKTWIQRYWHYPITQPAGCWMMHCMHDQSITRKLYTSIYKYISKVEHL